jgi:hypothetical protein
MNLEEIMVGINLWTDVKGEVWYQQENNVKVHLRAMRFEGVN